MDDRFGSPSTADVETFARAFDAELDAALGDFADELEREVSSPVRPASRRVLAGVSDRVSERTHGQSQDCSRGCSHAG